MLGRIVGGGLALVALAAVLAGPAEGRGGNHSCDFEEGTIRSDHFWPGGDVLIVGFYTNEVGFPPSPQEVITAENWGNDKGSNGLSCGSPPGTWSLLTSDLGPGDDRARLDAVGLRYKYDTPPLPLPARIPTAISGGTGEDLIRGHAGIDDISGGGGGDRLIPFDGRDRVQGGGGADVIKAAGGGKDEVECGAGRDKAVVSERDRTRRCERVIVR